MELGRLGGEKVFSVLAVERDVLDVELGLNLLHQFVNFI